MPHWTLADYVSHYNETISKQPNAWGQYLSPIFGQSHYIIIAACRRFGETASEAFR